MSDTDSYWKNIFTNTSVDLYGRVGRTQIDDIISDCLQNKQTVAFAESCTGGLISAAFGQKSGVSEVYRGGVVAYHGEVKQKILGVKKSTLEAHGEVSVEVAREMALGAKEQLGCDWCVSVTGIAGPSGGTENKPVGTVCFAVVGPGFEKVEMQHFKQENRVEIQLESARFAIQFLRDSIHA